MAYCLTLSDTRISPANEWRVVIFTLYSESEIVTNLYKSLLNCGISKFSAFTLGTQGLGGREEIPAGMVHQIATMIKAETSNICRTQGRINLLIGQGTGSILLRTLTHMNGEKISSFLPQIARDLSLHRIEASEDHTSNCQMFRSKLEKGNFTFYADPTPTEVSNLKTS